MAKFRLLSAASYRWISKASGKLYTFVGVDVVEVENILDIHSFRGMPDRFEEVPEGDEIPPPVGVVQHRRKPRSLQTLGVTRKSKPLKSNPMAPPPPKPVEKVEDDVPAPVVDKPKVVITAKKKRAKKKKDTPADGGMVTDPTPDPKLDAEEK